MTEQDRKRAPEEPTNTQRQHEEPYESQMESGTNIGPGLGGQRAGSTTDYGAGTDREGHQGGERELGDTPEAQSGGGPAAAGASFVPDETSSPMPVGGEADSITTPGLGGQEEDITETQPLRDEPGRSLTPGVEGSSSSPAATGSGGGSGLSSDPQRRTPLGEEPNQASTVDHAGAPGFADAADRRTSSGIGGIPDRGTERGSGVSDSGGGGTTSGLGAGEQSNTERRKTTPLSGNLDQDTVD